MFLLAIVVEASSPEVLEVVVKNVPEEVGGRLAAPAEGGGRGGLLPSLLAMGRSWWGMTSPPGPARDCWKCRSK